MGRALETGGSAVMQAVPITVATAVGLFAGTNIDDMVVLAVLNASAQADGHPARWQIWVGQYTGIAVLTVISLVAALGLALVPGGWIWLLGLMPLTLGVHKLFIAVRAHRSGDPVSPAMATGLPGVIGLTIANGGDNVAAYTPVFRTLDVGDTAVTLVVFAVGVALWCFLGSWLVARHKIVQDRAHWIVPVVLILIGLYVVYKSGVLGL
jgi:cadmium resistance protein CadD (predicted permease)